MNPLIFLTKWFWVVWIAVTFINAAAIQSRARPRIIANPELRDGYRTITRGLLTWGNLPWCIMGIGILFGGVPSVFDFFRPRDGNPFVLAFFVSVLFVWLLGTHWLLFRGGAEMLVKHPGVMNMDLKSSRAVKIYWFICLTAGVVAVISNALTFHVEFGQFDLPGISAGLMCIPDVRYCLGSCPQNSSRIFSQCFFWSLRDAPALR